MQELLTVSISILNKLCQSTPLFCSFVLNHPDFKEQKENSRSKKAVNIVPTIVELIDRFANFDDNHNINSSNYGKGKGKSRGGDHQFPNLHRQDFEVKEDGDAHLVEDKEESLKRKDHRGLLVQNVLDLVETLTWDPAEVCYSTLESFIKSERMIEILTDARQSKQFICQSLTIITSILFRLSSIDILLLIQCKPQVFNRPNFLNGNHRSAALNVTRREASNIESGFPMLERLLGLLDNFEEHQIRIKVLRILMNLSVDNSNNNSVSQRDERGDLRRRTGDSGAYLLTKRTGNSLIQRKIGESKLITTSLIRVISKNCSILWNGDGGYLHLSRIPLCIDEIELAIEMIYRLIFELDQGPEEGQSEVEGMNRRIFNRSSGGNDLMDRLQESSRISPGIHHEFVVCLSKLTFSELPLVGSARVGKEQLIRLDIISDLAYELVRSVASPDELRDWKICSADDDEDDEDDEDSNKSQDG
ncbi:hypothetical protein BY996DRAFT_7364656 [Phakopsora pachyrhizi]|nr:hypothetical protein BY996DRAFT_7364656 [Phakopsora pachyrhizi]